MRHAFLIIAHNNWGQLKTLISLLDHENHDLYVHIDKKSKDFDAEQFRGITQKSALFLYQEYKVYWGGYSQVQVELFLFERAHTKGYEYYHVISGADLPLKTNEEMQAFFEQNQGKEFIDFDEEKLKYDPEISRRTRLYHLLQNYRRAFKSKGLNALATFCERVLLALQIVLRVNRVRKLDWTVKYGSNWVSITDRLVETLLDNKEKIRKVFSYTNSADELFVQTIAYNSGFAGAITGNGRLVDWERGKNGNPYTFCIEDYEYLTTKTDYLFARKFSETADKEIIDKMVLRIKGEKK